MFRDRIMAIWHCWDRISGERFEFRGSPEELEKQIESYISDGIDGDTGEVEYDVLATAIDGSEHFFSGIARAD